MIREVKTKAMEREKACLERISFLEQSNKKLIAELEERKHFQLHPNQSSQLKNLQSVNAELYQKLDEVINSSETARERLRVFNEWKHWKAKPGNEEFRKLQTELEEQKKQAKKCKSDYLKAKKERRVGNEESSEGSVSSSASPGAQVVGEKKARGNKYGARQMTSTRANPP
eukprot:TRINITY_DN14429_c0_g4_i1.p1 TRINITY_DN14429_c0_g4~~TRINITY_DN14429_c0_g4_i1.p1  ORF type:complete len:171 (-),score=73.87 TRINITY_DN14429_c0_g4_i1:93-605(-)